jgi:hypothetical protein
VARRFMDNAPRLAGVMELVDVPDSKSGAARRGGSSPPPGTNKHTQENLKILTVSIKQPACPGLPVFCRAKFPASA